MADVMEVTAAVPVRRGRPNLKEIALKHLRDRILSGELRPGTKIEQDHIAAELGISRLPVREALITLEAEGLVDNVARRGSFVAAIHPQDILDHYEMFGLLAGLAAKRAAERMDEAGFAQIEAMIDRMDATDDPAELDELNYLFHRQVNKAGSSRRLTVVLRLLSASMPTNYFEYNAAWKRQAVVEHRAILDALRSRDGEAASAATVTHFRDVGTWAVARLRTAGFWDDPHA